MTGGYNNFTPAPIPQKKKDVGWVWALAGCGGLIVLLVIGIAVAFTSNKRSNPAKIFSAAVEASRDGQQLIPIRDSIKKYREGHGGAYPSQLKDLVPAYLTQEDLDFLAEGKALYARPGKDAPSDFAVVTLATKQSEIFGQKQFYYAKILKDDEVVMDQVTRSNLESRNPFSSSSPTQDDDTK